MLMGDVIGLNIDRCDNCGEIFKYIKEVPENATKKDRDLWARGNQLHILEELKIPDYGSHPFDGCRVRFKICDVCLSKIVNGLSEEAQMKIENKEWNYMQKNRCNIYGEDTGTNQTF